MALTLTTVLSLTKALSDIPHLIKRFGKDGECIRIFVDEWSAELLASKDADSTKILIEVVPMLVLKAMEGIRNWKFYNPSTYDIFKPMRLKADELAIILNFERYLERRKQP